MVEAAEATHNPVALCMALLADGFTFREADPARALAAMRRGLTLAQDTGNRMAETQLAAVLCRVEAKYGDPLAALDYCELAIRNHYESGNATVISTPMAVLAAAFDRLGRYEAAATIAGFTFSPVTAASFRELDTRSRPSTRGAGKQCRTSRMLSLGAAMTMAAMANYAFDQIDQARTELEKSR